MKKIIIIYALLGLAALYSSTDILYLKADYLSGLVKIQWQSSSEVNVKEFVIEKSSDNISFYKLTSEMPKGSSSAYTIFDLDPHSKEIVLFYRVIVVDYDGSRRVSDDTVSVKVPTAGISATWGSIKALFR